MRSFFLQALSFAFILIFPLFAIPNNKNFAGPEGYPVYSTPWVDSVFTSLSLEERIAQLLMIRIHTDREENYYDSIARLVMNYNVGGVTFFRGGPKRQVLNTNRLQSQAKTPLLVSMDAEWGPAMRLDSLIPFPRQMALGAINDDKLIYRMGLEVGRQLKRLGVHINFAPVVDVNNNPDNPVINFRAFGEDRYRVADKGLAYMHGLQDTGVFACAKHFPGHGDTDADSHYTLPLLKHSFEEVDSIHLYPFKRLINEGLHSVMIAHLELPSMEPEPKLASTLSHNIVTNLLQIQMGFEGLIITDALDMQGVSDYFQSGELELRALMAGNDILLLPEDVPAAIQTIKNAVLDGTISEEMVNAKTRKILYYKQKAGLDDFQYIQLDNLIQDLNTLEAEILQKQLVQAAITLARNEKNLVPVTGLGKRKIAALSIGAPTNNRFQQVLGKYGAVSCYGIDKYHSPYRAAQILEDLGKYDLVIISVHNNSFFPRNNYGINGKTVGLISAIAKRHDVILSIFANPYSLKIFDDAILDVESVIIAYQDGDIYEEAAADAVFGGLQTTGRLPVRVGKHFPLHSGIISPEPSRVRFGRAEETGINTSFLTAIDSIALEGIKQKAYPGCQIAVIKDGVLIYNKAFGKHTYDEDAIKVDVNDLYDLASVTKTVAGTMAVMHLVEDGRVSLDAPITKYIPWLYESNKEAVTLRTILAHQARFTPWIPFYLSTLDNGEFIPGIYSQQQSKEYPVKVARDLYINKHFRDTIFAQILASELREKNEYRYSDLGFILLPILVENVTGQLFDEFLGEFIYKPMGLTTIGFNPLKRFDLHQIAPTEHDPLWRKQVVHGHVHDPAAAMLGGVSAHAGLFGNARDVATLKYMLLNDGNYGGEQFFLPNTIKEFTSVQFAHNKNRRALGFDKPGLEPEKESPAAKSASPLSFGHSGFTGTYAWADPAENLVYVFLSNRTYPSQSNRKIVELSIRTGIQQAIYDAIDRSREMDYLTIEIPEFKKDQKIFDNNHN